MGNNKDSFKPKFKPIVHLEVVTGKGSASYYYSFGHYDSSMGKFDPAKYKQSFFVKINEIHDLMGKKISSHEVVYGGNKGLTREPSSRQLNTIKDQLLRNSINRSRIDKFYMIHLGSEGAGGRMALAARLGFVHRAFSNSDVITRDSRPLYKETSKNFFYIPGSGLLRTYEKTNHPDLRTQHVEILTKFKRPKLLQEAKHLLGNKEVFSTKKGLMKNNLPIHFTHPGFTKTFKTNISKPVLNIMPIKSSNSKTGLLLGLGALALGGAAAYGIHKYNQHKGTRKEALLSKAEVGRRISVGLKKSNKIKHK